MKLDAYHLLLEISDELRNIAYDRRIIEEKYTMNGVTRKITEHNTLALKNLEWANMSSGWMDGLSNTAIMFATKNLVPALKYSNMLWHWPLTAKSQEKRALKELVDNKILFRTEEVGIYLVNPLKIWRGNPIICVEATKALIRSAGKPTTDMIRDLRPGDKYTARTEADQFRSLTDNDITPNLLEEPPAT